MKPNEIADRLEEVALKTAREAGFDDYGNVIAEAIAHLRATPQTPQPAAPAAVEASDRQLLEDAALALQFGTLECRQLIERIHARIGWEVAAPSQPAEPTCDDCHGTGAICVGSSGRDEDGNSLLLERCPTCGYGDAEPTEPVARAIANFAAAQEPLGADFAQALHDNAWDLYEGKPVAQAEQPSPIAADDDLPPLPEPFKYPRGVVVGPCACGSWPGGDCFKCPPINFFTTDQMREYGRLCRTSDRDAIRDAALEEAAKVPREYAMKLEKGFFGNRFPDELTEIFNASTNMADDIRALKSAGKGEQS